MNNEQSLYFRILASWANSISQLTDKGVLQTLAKEFNHDARNHAARLIAEAELFMPTQRAADVNSDENAADKWVFETNGEKWSNNDNTAGDNYGSFLAGCQHVRSQQQQKDKLLQEMAQTLGLAKYDLRSWVKTFPEVVIDDTAELITTIEALLTKYNNLP